MIAVVLLAACRKGEPLIGKRSASTLDTPLHLQLDTACLHAPNLITPNGDGINDRFIMVIGEEPASFNLTITNPNGTVVQSSIVNHGWSGFDAEFIDEPGPVPYLYDLHIITNEGTEHHVSKVFHVIRDVEGECITNGIAPLFGDMLDPRRCDIPYQTNDHVCVE